jgi:hypothetical protein
VVQAPDDRGLNLHVGLEVADIRDHAVELVVKATQKGQGVAFKTDIVTLAGPALY